jgi:hypothetical protein
LAIVVDNNEKSTRMFARLHYCFCVVFTLLSAAASAEHNENHLIAAAPLWEATDGDIAVQAEPTMAIAAVTATSENSALLAVALAGVVLIAILAFCIGVYTGSVIKRNTLLSREMMAQRIGPGGSTGIDVRTGETVFIQTAAGASMLSSAGVARLQPVSAAAPPPPPQHRQTSAASATLSQYSGASANNVLAGFRVNGMRKQPAKAQ